MSLEDLQVIGFFGGIALGFIGLNWLVYRMGKRDARRGVGRELGKLSAKMIDLARENAALKAERDQELQYFTDRITERYAEEDRLTKERDQAIQERDDVMHQLADQCDICRREHYVKLKSRHYSRLGK